MTQAATHFVGPVTFAGITGEAAITDLWDPEAAGEKHVELSAWADLMIITPATANLIARAAHGLADDAVLATIACADMPIAFAPAMHTRMWHQRTTQENVAKLEARGWKRIGPVRGPLASGDVGIGRMSEPVDICTTLEQLIATRQSARLDGTRVIVTAGPTREALDPVRFLSNLSSGKMGYAIAEAAQARGANVVLISGPTHLAPPAGVTFIPVESAIQMYDAVLAQREHADAFVMAAAVSDYRPAFVETQKIKKGNATLTLTLERNPDILATLGEQAKRPFVLIGFALETNDVLEHAKEKLERKRCDLIVANEARSAFAGDDNQVWLVESSGVTALQRQSKDAIAHRLMDWLQTRRSKQAVE